MSVRPLRLKMLQQFEKFKKILILVGTPLLLLPLAVSTKEAACGYVIAIMAVYWCTEVLPLAVTALLPAFLFPVLGIMKSKSVCMEYMKDTNMLFVGGLMVALCVEHWNLHKRIALRVLLLVGVQPALLMLGFMGVTAFLSMWISNTATTAMMVPIVQAVLDQLLGNRNKVGGAVEKVRRQSNTVSVQTSIEEMADPNIPSKDLNLSTNHNQSEEVISPEETEAPNQVELEELSDEEKKRLCKGLMISVCYAASIGGTATLTGTGPNLVLIGQMSQLFPRNGDVINFVSWFAFAFPNMLLMLALSWFWLQFLFIDWNLKKSLSCGSAQSVKEKAVYEALREEHKRLGPMSYGETSILVLFVVMVVLWFTRYPGFMHGWSNLIFKNKAEFITDATVALFIAILMFILPCEAPHYLCFWRYSNSEGQQSPGPAPPLLTWKVAQNKLPWDIILLLGGGFALAKGSEESGLSRWLGDQMAPLNTIPGWAIAIIICLLVTTFTECASNVATATLFLPVLASMSQSIGLNPLYVMIPCTVSASFAFMLPVATPPNALVFSSGYIKVADMAKAGVMMNVIGMSCITLAINSWGRPLFSLDTFPSWANNTFNKTSLT